MLDYGLKSEVHFQIMCRFDEGEITEWQRDVLLASIERINNNLMSNDYLWDFINPIINDEIDNFLK